MIRTQEDFAARDPFSPAFLWVPPDLVEPLWHMLRSLCEHSAEGEVSRALQLLLIGLDEQDYQVIGTAANDLLRALNTLGRQRVLSMVDMLGRLGQIGAGGTPPGGTPLGGAPPGGAPQEHLTQELSSEPELKKQGGSEQSGGRS